MLVARHGAAVYETDTVTDAGGSLSPEGRAQSRALAARLAADEVAHVYCSSMSRATQTAELVAGALDVGVTVREGLREFAVGDLEGAPSEPDPVRPVYQRWVEGDLDARVPGGESATDGISRMRAVLEGAVETHPGRTVLVVSHGGLICTALPHLARNLTIARVHQRHIANCDPVEMSYDEGGWVALGWPGLDL